VSVTWRGLPGVANPREPQGMFRVFVVVYLAVSDHIAA
jgi:hypothetical protein